MTMCYKLTCLTASTCQTDAEHDIIKAALKQAEKILTCYARHLLCALVILTELLLHDAINELSLLLLFELHTILAYFAALAARLALGLLAESNYCWLEAERTAPFQ